MGSGRWEDEVTRIVIHTPHYLDFDGSERRGGRARLLAELLSIITEDWGRPVTVIQKGHQDFHKTDSHGVPVIGVRAPLSTYGDVTLGRRARRHLRPDDGVLYGAGAQGAWPFHVQGAKGVQHGIGWDGPYSAVNRGYHERVNLDFVRAARSVLCVDTNYINWVRQQGALGVELASKCTYMPNFADLERLPVAEPERAPHTPLRLLYARRYEPKRGPSLFVGALSLLKQRGIAFEATMFSVGGVDVLERTLADAGLSDAVAVRTAGMDAILDEYAAHDVAVVPTVWSEGTSLAAVEAICAGLPVIATPVGGLGNLIVPDFNGRLVAPRAEEIADAIADYAQDSAMWTRHRRACLSLRPALSRRRWRAGALRWLRG